MIPVRITHPTDLPRRASLNRCFVVLGAAKDEVYYSVKTNGNRRLLGRTVRTLRERYTKWEMLGWAKNLHHIAIQSAHPDKGGSDDQGAAINAAYDRIRHILKDKKGGFR